MKFFLQTILILFFILIIFISYSKYFVSNDELNATRKQNQNKDVINIELKNTLVDDNNKLNTSNENNNLIKNLKYEIKLLDNSKYIINSNLSEMNYDNGNEIIYMSDVDATFIDKKNISLKIKADKAVYNSSNNNTNFKNNIIITYLDNTILAEKVDLDFIKNTILIYENTLYKNPRGTIKTDNIKIDLITKNISMYMNESKNKIQIKSN